MTWCYGISKNGIPDLNYFEKSFKIAYRYYLTLKNNDHCSEYKLFLWKCEKGNDISQEEIENYFKIINSD